MLGLKRGYKVYMLGLYRGYKVYMLGLYYIGIIGCICWFF